MNIWAEKDLPFQTRQALNLLLAIRKDFIEHGFRKAGFYVDKDAMDLQYYGDSILILYFAEGDLHYDINESWMQFLMEGKFEDLKQECNEKLAKGKGKGKKGKQSTASPQ